MNRVVVTGANGFIGRHLCSRLREFKGVQLAELSRASGPSLKKSPPLTKEANWHPFLSECDALIHLAGRAHVKKPADNESELIQEINVAATLNLARQCIAAGVRRFIFMSTIGVYEGCEDKSNLNENTPVYPVSLYAKSKLEAEAGLRELFSNAAADLVIIRPPLVYAWDAPGNFAALLKLVNRIPVLPFNGCQAPRSIVYIDNLVDFIVCCLQSEKSINDTFICTDEQPTSLSEMIQSIAVGLGKKPVLLSIPQGILALTFKLIGKASLLEKVAGTYATKSNNCQRLLGWKPKIATREALVAASSEHHKNTQ
jgi:nucleoside-diphosphate-sugar epimerase